MRRVREPGCSPPDSNPFSDGNDKHEGERSADSDGNDKHEGEGEGEGSSDNIEGTFVASDKPSPQPGADRC